MGMGPRSRLKARRLAMRPYVSLAAMGRRIGVDARTVQRWETGESDPYPRQWRDIARGYEWPYQYLGDLLARDDELPGGTDGRLPADRELTEFWNDDDVDRRTFIAGLGGSLAATVTHLEHIAMSAGTSYEQRLVTLRLLGHAHHAAGEAAFDQLDLAVAADHFHQAHQLGVELGDPDMIAAAQVQLGDIARRQRRYSTALRLLDTATRHATTGSLLTQVRRSQTLARAYAEMGDRSAFDRAIVQAEDIAGRISPEHHREGDHSPRGIRLERGQGLTLLGDPGAALAIYAQSAPPTFRSDRERGSFLIIHAQAIAGSGDLAEGVRLAIHGLELARGYDSPRHVSRVQRMYDRLARTWSPAEPALADLRDALAA